ncbi:MAG: methyl-accepting chemotaxis protein [Gammaproteobacteria bacterium]|nr:methyl-accepting chemotaxis protein [Gammaproteobacteria bacterium]MBI5616247.1 methyl-accepting chemotaxis protein [Gammaproteobacteria bacterium]
MGGIWVILVVVWTSMVLWTVEGQRDISTRQAEQFAGSVHEMTLAGLTSMMITGTVAQRPQFLDQIRELNKIRDLRVLRGEPVRTQFGPGDPAESAKDDIERKVLATGEVYKHVDKDGEMLRVVMPARNRTNYLGKNCTMCHTAAPENAVLGAVSMNIDLKEVNAEANAFGERVYLFAVLVSLPTLAFLYFFITRFVTGPLKRMTGGLQDIAGGEGDLAHRLPVVGHDEIGQASLAFNSMMENLSGLIRRVRDSTASLARHADELFVVTDQTNQGVSRQRSEISEFAGAMNQMAGAVQDVAGNAQRAAQAAHTAYDSLSAGKQVVIRTVDGIQTLASEVEQAAEVIRRLEKDSESISTVLNVIRGIAEQTNLLALNAAIEAARAGDSGRGFAVVADEVRLLATRTQESTEEIRSKIEELQKATREAVAVMDRGRERARGEAEQAAEANTALEAINASVTTINEVNTQIAAAAETQSTVAREISRNVANISDAAEQNAEAARRTTGAGEELARLAKELDGMVRRFKV